MSDQLDGLRSDVRRLRRELSAATLHLAELESRFSPRARAVAAYLEGLGWSVGLTEIQAALAFTREESEDT